MQKNGGQKAHIKERIKKGIAVMGNREKEGRLRKEVWLFDVLI